MPNVPQSLAHHLAALSPDAVLHHTGDLDVGISAPFAESDADVQVGGVFVARRGRSSDGHRYIASALTRGAAAIVGEAHPDELGALPVPYVQLRDVRQALGRLAASFYGFPTRAMVVVGVTGTDGKTTTTTLLHSILQQMTGGRTGYVSTIAARIGEQALDTGFHVTTPGAPQLQGYLAQMRDAQLSHAVIEMTSHGLEQGRLVGVELDAAVITNITHEHLDYHGTWEAYREAKATMFRMLAGSLAKGLPKTSILNRDDAGSYAYLAALASEQQASYSLVAPADFQADELRYAPDGTHFVVQGEALRLNLVGAFNVYNALAATAAARALGASWDDVRAGLAAVQGVSGRMERIDAGQDFTAIVDFAHTPNALEKALGAARAMLADSGGRLIVVFGSAGLRDVQKRRLMAEAAARHADFSIHTAEDPRTERLEDILAMMAEGAQAGGGVAGRSYIQIADRGAAIAAACQQAQAGDMVLVCGKGHEQSMCFGTIEYPWDDREALRAALRGTPLQTLPTAQGGPHAPE